MPKVFISYRRADSKHATGRIGDKLIETFGRENVLKDVDTLPLGRDFRVELRKLIPQADVLLAIIGEKWLNIRDAQGRRRLENEADWVRVEIETALYANIPVIPILLGKAQLPQPQELPPSLAPLASCSSIKIGPDPLFRHDVKRLIAALEATLRERAIEATLVASVVGPDAATKAQSALDLLVAELVAAEQQAQPWRKWLEMAAPLWPYARWYISGLILGTAFVAWVMFERVPEAIAWTSGLLFPLGALIIFPWIVERHWRRRGGSHEEFLAWRAKGEGQKAYLVGYIAAVLLFCVPGVTIGYTIWKPLRAFDDRMIEEEARRKKWLEDLTKNLPTLMPEPPQLKPEDLQGVFPKELLQPPVETPPAEDLPTNEPAGEAATEPMIP
jgi:hypothetical protein